MSYIEVLEVSLDEIKLNREVLEEEIRHHSEMVERLQRQHEVCNKRIDEETKYIKETKTLTQPENLEEENTIQAWEKCLWGTTGKLEQFQNEFMDNNSHILGVYWNSTSMSIVHMSGNRQSWTNFSIQSWLEFYEAK